MTTAEITLPKLDGFETYYGMQVSSVGEDGDLCVLGHQPILRALAAMNAYSRHTIGLLDMFDGGGGKVVDILPRLRWTWMVNCVPLGACLRHVEKPDEDDCSACWEVRDFAKYKRGWWLMEAAARTPGAFPVTWWSA